MGFIGAIYLPAINKPESPDSSVRIDKNASYLECCANTLLVIYQDDSLVVHYQNAAKGLVTIFASKVINGIEVFNKFLGDSFTEITTQPSSAKVQLLKTLCFEALAIWVHRFAENLIELVTTYWKKSNVTADIIDLVPVLVNVLGDRFGECLSLVGANLLFDIKSINEEIPKEVLTAVASLRQISSDYISIVLPEITAIISSSTSMRIHGLVTLRILIQNCPCSVFASSVFRCTLVVVQD